MKRLILSFALLSLCLCAQDGISVNQVAGPPPRAMQQLLTYSGNNVTYVCWALSTQPFQSPAISISAGSNASPVSLTSTAHGFDATSLPQVTISGGTGNWAAVNGTWTATITGVNTFTIPVDSGAFGAVTGTLTFTTRAPRKSQSVWAVQQLAYDGSNNVIGTYWVGGSTSFSHACTTPTQYQ